MGYALLKRLPGRIEILNLVIFPLFRSKGYGRILLQTIEDVSHSEGCTGIWLEVQDGNQPAVELYLSGGYLPVGRRRGYYTAASGEGEPADAILMEKCLSEGLPQVSGS